MEAAEGLVAFRLDAAEKSGGTSSAHIKDFILRLISPMEGVEKVLDKKKFSNVSNILHLPWKPRKAFENYLTWPMPMVYVLLFG